MKSMPEYKKKKRKEKFCKSVFKFNGKEFIRLEIKCNLDDADMNRNMNPIFFEPLSQKNTR